MKQQACELCMDSLATTTYETTNFEYAVCEYCRNLAEFEEFDDDQEW